MKIDLQSSKKENCCHTELLFLGHLQLRHDPHRQRQNGSVKQDIRHLHTYKEVQVIDASSWNFGIPSFLDGYTLESPKKVIDEEPYKDKASKEYDRAPERSRGEDTTVEEEDGELDGCDRGAVELGGYVDCLSWIFSEMNIQKHIYI